MLLVMGLTADEGLVGRLPLVGGHGAVVVGGGVAVLNESVVNEACRLLRVAKEDDAAEAHRLACLIRRACATHISPTSACGEISATSWQRAHVISAIFTWDLSAFSPLYAREGSTHRAGRAAPPPWPRGRCT